MLPTPESIRTLQRKLYRKGKQQPAFRFYALYDKVYRDDILSHAYCLVRANQGSAGVDGVTFKAIEDAGGETAFIAELQEALKSKSYAPCPVKRVMIPKADGSKRPLGIPTIRDRVAQMAVKLVIEPIFEADFCDSSYGFRPKRSAHDAVNDIAYALNCGYTDVIDADVSKYFDSIPHTKLLGFTFRMRVSWSTGKAYPHVVQPSKKALQKIKSRMTEGLHSVSQQALVCEVRALQGADDSGLDPGACHAVKNIGKPCAGKPHARFDEGGLVTAVTVRLVRHRQTKGTGTDRPGLTPPKPALYSTRPFPAPSLFANQLLADHGLKRRFDRVRKEIINI